MTNAVIAGFVRTPFTQAHKGALAKVRPDDLAAAVLGGLVEKTGIAAEDIEDILMGCAFPEGEQGFNVAKIAGFIAKLPVNVAGATINRFCGSSMDAIHRAVGAIATGSGDAFLCAGVESMTRIPMGGFNPMPNPILFKDYPQAFISMGLTAENLARQYKIARDMQEAFALASHHKAVKAQKNGGFDDEIIAVGEVKQDGLPRGDASTEAMATLAPAFDKDGSVTAATSSPLTDGAAGVLVVSESYADKHKLPKLARIKSMAVAGCAPEVMGIGPVHAATKALNRAGLAIKDMDVVELNEAFAAQALAVVQELGIDEAKLNLHGGAVALGHPLGASGARITGKAAQLLHETKGRYALATMCIGGGQGIATVLEKV